MTRLNYCDIILLKKGEDIEMLTEESRKKMSEKKKGENNPRWNGGNSQYPDHAELKRVRVEVLKKSKGKCEICEKPAKIVHLKVD